MDCILQELNAPNHPYPVALKKDSMYFIFIEKQKIPCAQSVLEAVSVMVATNWIFNIEFPTKIRKTMQFIPADPIHLPEKHLPEITFPQKTLGRNYIIPNIHFPERAFSRNYISLNIHLPEITFS